MTLFKRFIDWIRWYRSEEGRQTRLFNFESWKLHWRAHWHRAEGTKAWNELIVKTRELYRKYPKSRQAVEWKIEHDRYRPSYMTEEEWDQLPLKPVRK